MRRGLKCIVFRLILFSLLFVSPVTCFVLPCCSELKVCQYGGLEHAYVGSISLYSRVFCCIFSFYDR